MSASYYEILGISPDASPDEVKKGYRRVMRSHHSDVHGDMDDPIVRLINEAHEILSDPDRRRQYDRQHAGRPEQGPSEHQKPHQNGRSREGERVRKETISCTKCNGKGRGVFFQCDRCGGSGKLIRRTCPRDRAFCRVCEGLGEVPPGKGALIGLSFLGMSEPCPLCEGKGLEPLPKVPAEHSCQTCRGFGFSMGANLLGGKERRRCSACWGFGVNSNLSPAILLSYGLRKERCSTCEGRGYDRTLGPTSPCNRCLENGWVPAKLQPQ